MRTTPGTESGPPVFDRESAVERVGGALRILLQICRMFTEGWVQSRSEFEAALEAGDGQEVRRVAHRVKGTAGTRSAGVVAKTAAELELLGSRGEMEEARALFQELELAVGEFEEAVSLTAGELGDL